MMHVSIATIVTVSLLCYQAQSQLHLGGHSLAIIKGVTANRRSWRWYVKLGVGWGLCGGSLVSERFVVTARHCVCNKRGWSHNTGSTCTATKGNTPVEQMRIVTGDWAAYVPDPGEQIYNARKLWIHPDGYDIAVLEIPPVKLSQWVSIIPLASKQARKRDTVWACGFGLTEHPTSMLPRYLQEIQLSVMDLPCKFNHTTPSRCSHCVCASSSYHTDEYANICNGDSGGPLMIQRGSYHHATWELVGVTSATYGPTNAICQSPNGYGIFVDTTQPVVRNWIESIIGLESYLFCRVYDDPHMYTFDKTYYDYHGTCEFILSKQCSKTSLKTTLGIPQFEVLAQNNKSFSNPSSNGWWPTCARKSIVTLKIDSVEVTLESRVSSRIVAKVNGSIINVPHTIMQSDADFFLDIYKDPLHTNGIAIETSFGMKVYHFGSHYGIRLNKWLATNTQGSLCGMCGQHNYRKGDDFTLADGTQYQPSPGPTEVMHLPQEYSDAYTPDNNNPPGCTRASYVTNHTVAKRDVQHKGCSGKALSYAKQACGVINDKNGPFAVCHSNAENRNAGYTNCINDVCGSSQFLCSNLAGYAAICGEVGQVSQWRKNTGCYMKCPRGKVYSSAVSSDCIPTCYNPKPCGRKKTTDGGVTEEGCICKPGHVWDGDQCIRRSKCWRTRMKWRNLKSKQNVLNEKCRESKNPEKRVRCLLKENLNNGACKGLYGPEKKNCILDMIANGN